MKLIKYLLVFIIACNPVKNVDGWEEIKTSQYSIFYPPDWKMSNSGIYQTEFIIYMPENEDGSFRENINFLTQEISSGPMELKEYVKLSEEQIIQFVDSSEIRTSEKFSMDGHDFYELVYTGQQGLYHLKWKQWVCIRDDRVYLLTYSADEKQYEAYQETVDRIFHSLSFR